MSQRITVAIVGAGIGREHLTGYLALPERFEVKVLCDLDQDRAAEVIAAEPAVFEPIAVESELDKVLADDSIDLVDVCLPPHLHLPTVLAVLAAGKHVVCEKPLVTSLADVEKVAKAAAAAGRSVFPVFQYRYGLAMSQLQALIAAGLAGKPLTASMETHWHRDSEYYAVPWRGTWAGEQGGAVLGHAIHNHDLLSTIFGPVAELAASTETRVNDIEVEDCAAIVFRMASGAVVTSSITLGASTDTSRLRFCFSGLTAESGSTPYSPMTDTWTFSAREPVKQEDVDAVVAQVQAVKTGFAAFLDALADSLQGKAGREVTLEDGRRSIELVSAIYKSNADSRFVRLPLAAQDPFYQNWIPTA